MVIRTRTPIICEVKLELQGQFRIYCMLKRKKELQAKFQENKTDI